MNKPAPRGTDAETIRAEILEKLAYSIGKDPAVAKRHDWLNATVLALRDRIIDRWMESTRRAYQTKSKRVYYLSLEFLIGRLMRDALRNLQLNDAFTKALQALNVDIDLIEALEPDAALGNGGLGRLAACFMESMASLDIPAYGYGIRYNHGLFRQKIIDGWQIELPENWLEHGNRWEFPRREAAYEIGFGGQVVPGLETGNKQQRRWKPGEKLLASACDTPMVGWRGKRVNTLRLWTARAVDPIRLDAFNSGDYGAALAESNKAEIITRVLYPADSTPAGQELRLRQEYFFTSASLQDLIRRHVQQYDEVRSLADKVAIQLNDTHPAIAVAELMRILVDNHALDWDEAWSITKDCIGYTNHTLLPEALESWPVHLFEHVLPRHMQIVYQINAKLIAEAQKRPGCTSEFLASVSLIDEHNGRRVRMGQLAFAGSHSINGVSALHTSLMKQSVFRDLNALYPGRINNKTNGITPRRWLLGVNPQLATLLTDSIGPAVLDDAANLVKATSFAKDAGFKARFSTIKRHNKAELSNLIAARMGLKVDPSAMFDVQVKRIHEYKRQLLNILETIALYNSMRAHPDRPWVPRVKIFAGKAAASYAQAKLIIKLANDVGAVVNNDPDIRDLLKVVFIPNYNVSLAEVIVPAADLSEQISTAGMEASGTGNMKFALNGAMTIGTLDGANIEIMEHVGRDNIVIFGMTTEEVEQKRREGHDPRAVIEASVDLKGVLDALASGVFSPDDANRYRPIIDSLYNGDWFMVAADFDAYAKAQREVDAIWRQTGDWTEKTILNTVNMGWFSSDRTIREYARDIWNVPVA
ncbi:glycogen/starch/alpha-glucan phosphorylase [Aestuariivirga sp.]|uniref:glycogen/starch/alpha-glucan phosphorylase n=1 Tax=Aestuariivirga sp. TaxID=2650926 RepID=UPI0035944402